MSRYEEIKKAYSKRCGGLYPYGEEIEKRIITCMNDIPLLFTEDEYYIELKYEHYAIKLWNANKDCAWLNRGELIINGGRKCEWEHSMPSIETLVNFAKYLDKLDRIKEIESNELLSNTSKKIFINDVKIEFYSSNEKQISKNEKKGFDKIKLNLFNRYLDSIFAKG